MNYASYWIQTYIILYVFAFDIELKTNETWLKDDII